MHRFAQKNLILAAIFFSVTLGLLSTTHGDAPAAANAKTSLMLAAENNDVEAIGILLAAGEEVNASTGCGCTALTIASKKGHYNAVERLLAAGANPNMQKRNGDTALIIALREGHTEIAALLEAAINAQAYQSTEEII